MISFCIRTLTISAGVPTKPPTAPIKQLAISEIPLGLSLKREEKELVGAKYVLYDIKSLKEVTCTLNMS